VPGSAAPHEEVCFDVSMRSTYKHPCLSSSCGELPEPDELCHVPTPLALRAELVCSALLSSPGFRCTKRTARCSCGEQRVGVLIALCYAVISCTRLTALRCVTDITAVLSERRDVRLISCSHSWTTRGCWLSAARNLQCLALLTKPRERAQHSYAETLRLSITKHASTAATTNSP
jgi:hypothetical protein